MKRSILMCLALGVTVFFFGCSNDDLMDLESVQSDQEVSTLKSMKNGNVKTPFTGTSNPYFIEEDGTEHGKKLVKGAYAEWYDVASDWRVTGDTFWYINSIVQADGTTKLWGKAEIIVEGENPGDESRGKWEMTWHGYLTPNPDVLNAFFIVANAVGQGKSGDVKGLVAHWTYTMDITNGFFYESKGYILSKK